MLTTPRPARTICLAILLVALASMPAVGAEAAKNTESASRIGPAGPLSAEQMLAIQAKRAADPGTLLAPTPAGRAEKLAGLPPSAAARVSPGVATAAGKPHLPADRASALSSLRSWRSFASRLGPIPRPEWSAPWIQAKPADVTVSRPRGEK